MVSMSVLTSIKEELSEYRDDTIKSTATLAEIDKSLDSVKKELKDLGIVDVDNPSEELSKMESEIQALFLDVKARLEKWRS